MSGFSGGEGEDDSSFLPQTKAVVKQLSSRRKREIVEAREALKTARSGSAQATALLRLNQLLALEKAVGQEVTIISRQGYVRWISVGGGLDVPVHVTELRKP